MNVFWTIYFICLGTTFLLTALAYVFYDVRTCYTTKHAEPIPIQHVIMVDICAAIPAVNFITTFVLIVFLFMGIFGGGLETKKKEK